MHKKTCSCNKKALKQEAEGLRQKDLWGFLWGYENASWKSPALPFFPRATKSKIAEMSI